MDLFSHLIIQVGGRFPSWGLSKAFKDRLEACPAQDIDTEQLMDPVVLPDMGIWHPSRAFWWPPPPSQPPIGLTGRVLTCPKAPGPSSPTPKTYEILEHLSKWENWKPLSLPALVLMNKLMFVLFCSLAVGEQSKP